VLYYPYGEERYREGTLQTDYQFMGQRRKGFGLYDYQARFHDPYLGRFVSADTTVPGVGSQAKSRYMYVKGNPLRYTDPSGHTLCDRPGKCVSPWKKIQKKEEEAEGQGTPPAGAQPVSSAPSGIALHPSMFGVLLDVTLAPPMPVEQDPLGKQVFAVGPPAVVGAYEAGRSTYNGVRMIQGGFAIVDATTLARGATYPGQMIVRGTAGAKEGARLVPQFTHAAAAHPALVPLTSPWAAAGQAVSEPATTVTLGIVYGVDIYEYGLGSKRDVGLNSSEFASAVTVDTAITLGPPALGAGVGTIFGPAGTVIGYGFGTVVSIALSVTVRDAAVSWTDEYIYGPAGQPIQRTDLGPRIH
jgi:RHS repeat-associated protein